MSSISLQAKNIASPKPTTANTVNGFNPQSAQKACDKSINDQTSQSMDKVGKSSKATPVGDPHPTSYQ